MLRRPYVLRFECHRRISRMHGRGLQFETLTVTPALESRATKSSRSDTIIVVKRARKPTLSTITSPGLFLSERRALLTALIESSCSLTVAHYGSIPQIERHAPKMREGGRLPRLRGLPRNKLYHASNVCPFSRLVRCAAYLVLALGCTRRETKCSGEKHGAARDALAHSSRGTAPAMSEHSLP